MAIAVLLCLVGLGVLSAAADQLVVGSSRVAARLGIAPIVIGVIVIGIGTSAPEFLVSGLAAAQGNGGLAVGNLVGSNILNLTLILGIAALMRPIAVASSVVRRETPLTLAAMLLFAVAVAIGLEPVTGSVLALATIAALWLLVRAATGTPDPVLATEAADRVAGTPAHPAAGTAAHPATEATRRPVGREIARTAVGLIGVLAGAQLLVVSAASVATRLGVPQLVIGFTLVAFGTSLPELVTSIQAQRRGEPDLLVGNLLGSNLFNSVAGGAIVGFAGGGRTAGLAWPLPALMVLVGVLVWALLGRGARLARTEAGVLLATYAACLPLLF